MRAICALALALLASGVATAQETGAAKPAPPAPCAGAEFHQFDFWIGQWRVTAGDKLAGHNTIAAIEGGCGLSERWRGAKGGGGVSYNAYDPADRQWHQFWISGQGYVLRLRGGLVDGAMVMTGEMPNPKTGKRDRQRITWTPQPDGSVRQFWEASEDGGATWTPQFDGLYRRADDAPPDPGRRDTGRP